jgi:hypothetical protein
MYVAEEWLFYGRSLGNERNTCGTNTGQARRKEEHGVGLQISDSFATIG